MDSDDALESLQDFLSFPDSLYTGNEIIFDNLKKNDSIILMRPNGLIEYDNVGFQGTLYIQRENNSNMFTIGYKETGSTLPPIMWWSIFWNEPIPCNNVEKVLRSFGGIGTVYTEILST